MRTTKLIAIGTVLGFAAIPLVAIPASSTLSYLELIAVIMQEVQRDYVRPVQVDVLAKNALKGMLTRLDPHSDYLDEQEYRETQADISGKFGGIGVEISVEDGVPKVIAPIDGTPAAKAHLEPGGLIVDIGGQSTQGMDSAKVINAIRGKPGSAVTLMISRGDKAPFRVTLQRDIIRAPSVKSELEPEGFGYVRISQFVDDTPKNFKEAIKVTDVIVFLYGAGNPEFGKSHRRDCVVAVGSDHSERVGNSRDGRSGIADRNAALEINRIREATTQKEKRTARYVRTT